MSPNGGPTGTGTTRHDDHDRTTGTGRPGRPDGTATGTRHGRGRRRCRWRAASDDDDGGGVHAGVTVAQPKLISLRFTGGVAKISAGDLDGADPADVQPVRRLSDRGQRASSSVDVGVDLTFTPVPYDDAMSVKKTGAADRRARRRRRDLRGRAEARPARRPRRRRARVRRHQRGGQPVHRRTARRRPARSACSRCASASSADYAFTPNVFVTVTPVAFTYSPAKDGLRDDIKSITRLDFMLGVGYRM